MRLRMELFVDDLDVSIAFYTRTLGFEVARRSDGYVSLRRGSVVLGLGPVAKLPARGAGPGFTRQRLAADRGAGVEIVLEVDRLRQVTALHERCVDQGVVVEALQLRPWGLHDFRVTDPDGYYLRITHGDAAASGPASAG
ncbi:VOC family protein [Couchioplanes caeruleus]|uniref:VOC family protein n=1 Tax=Couchioplanes caeruleus TaxID=56438 RepID=UPI0020BE7F96|nr:VOC family protein [Couchioplanes caeruleus]UQU68539.1 VOC family protein [Couchioplanes caeruleus]